MFYRIKLFILFFAFIETAYCEEATLVVSSTPPGAKVYIDKIYQGVTPVTITGAKIGNKYNLLLEASGYESYCDSIVFTTKEKQEKNITLKKKELTTGILNVSSTPPKAKVYVDNVYQGITPLNVEGFELNKKYTLLIKLDGYKEYSDTLVFPIPELVEKEIALSKELNKSDIYMEARRDAEVDVNKAMWFCVGVFGWVPGVIIASALDCNPPPTRLVNESSEYVSYYTEAYKKKAKDIQTQSASIGCLIPTACCVGPYFFGFLYSSAFY